MNFKFASNRSWITSFLCLICSAIWRPVAHSLTHFNHSFQASLSSQCSSGEPSIPWAKWSNRLTPSWTPCFSRALVYRNWFQINCGLDSDLIELECVWPAASVMGKWQAASNVIDSSIACNIRFRGKKKSYLYWNIVIINTESDCNPYCDHWNNDWNNALAIKNQNRLRTKICN